MKKAVIFGVTGQDGSYLAELLLSKGYYVVGVARRVSVDTSERIRHILNEPNFELCTGDITDAPLISKIFVLHQPDEVYNLAAQSHVGISFTNPSSTFDIDAKGVLNILENIHIHSPKSRFYQASTSEMFGSNYDEVKTYDDEGYGYSGGPPAPKVISTKKLQSERTEFAPNSPYAVAKLAGHNLVRVYRESYDIHASSGILFNHESERRGRNFVTRKITQYVAALYNHLNIPNKHHSEMDIVKSEMGLSRKIAYDFPKLQLGNLASCRDWGHAEDYVYGMWLMVQQEIPGDYVLATGETHSVEEFLQKSFEYIGIENYKDYYEINPEFYRPVEVDYLCGDASKAEEKLGWEQRITFDQLIQRMIDSDITSLNLDDEKTRNMTMFMEH